MFKPIQQPRGIRFRRFCHKAYAAFCSLHREVTIGRIAGYMTDLEMLKQGKSIAVAALLLVSGIAAAETDEGVPPDSTALTAQQLSLQEVLVTAQKAEVHSEAYRLITQVSHAGIQALPIQTVADILQYLPGIDVRTRGANGAQADISMRGGTFDQVVVLLNGVNLTDPQTGHYTLDLPVDISQIERIEVLQGTGMNLFGLSAFSGAINIITKPVVADDSQRVNVRMQGGAYGYFSPMVGGRVVRSRWHAGGYVRHDQSSGYMHNTDYQLSEVYAQGVSNIIIYIISHGIMSSNCRVACSGGWTNQELWCQQFLFAQIS